MGPHGREKEWPLNYTSNFYDPQNKSYSRLGKSCSTVGTPQEMSAVKRYYSCFRVWFFYHNKSLLLHI